ncbi:MAG: hypothetical protein FJ035_07335 [Chloroflexi bacterium]|nr:hypothetical protein [Chloroflexota bacterium]
MMRRGANYGWNRFEGTRCFGGGGCDRTGLTFPVVEYGHDLGCSVTGGVVYRGSAIPALVGATSTASTAAAGCGRCRRRVGRPCWSPSAATARSPRSARTPPARCTSWCTTPRS